jgi:alpha-L-arabinofuranosidase
MNRLFLSALIFLTLMTGLSFTQEPKTAMLDVAVDQPGITVSPSLYGIFFEEINLAGDGGIYPELIRNRSFEFSNQPDYWTTTNLESASATAYIETNIDRNDFNKKSLRVNLISIWGRNKFAIVNEGYWGIPITKGESYDLTVRVKADDSYNGSLNFRLISSDETVTHGTLKLSNIAKDWKTYSLRMKSGANDPKAKLAISPTAAGTFWLDYVSLKPAKTYKNHGLRIDLMEKLAALKPAFVRFPGGCWVEGNTMEEASRWKRTIGPESERWTQPNLWGYKSTNGLGYHEYLQMCEDLGTDAMFVINCGMSHKGVVPMDKMDEYVQDALDAVEYAVGSTRTTWGRKRAENGHSRPFPLKYLEIGNENGGNEYWERYDLFVPKIREKYPDIKIIANQWHGTVTNQVPIEIHDEHYYGDPAFFVQNVNKYDSYNRERKIYVGEYAVTKNCGLGNLNAAISEAVFMTGMERNSDVVVLSSYAPLFTNVNHRRWNPDLIVFDGTRSHGIPSYYVQQLFSVHRSSVIVPTTVSVPTPPVSSGCAGVGSWKTKVEYKDAKVEKNGETLFESKLDAPPEGATAVSGNWKFVNGVLRQESGQTDCRYLFGDENWSEYTFTVKARKIDGEEGFLILFNSRRDGTRAWLNIGGWTNSATALESGGIVGDQVDFKVEKDRWYDIRIEQKEQHVKCFIDNALILEQDLPPVIADGVFAVSGLNEKRDELIMKIVNSSPETYQTTISLQGAAKLESWVREIELTSESGLDENTLDNPEKVSPKKSIFPIDSPTFTKTLPGKSLTVLRVKVK